VVDVTSGPGATNCVTGLTNALMDSTPIVCITGQVPTHLIGNDAFQEADVVGITRPCTKYNYLVKDVRDLARVVKEAFFMPRAAAPAGGDRSAEGHHGGQGAVHLPGKRQPAVLTSRPGAGDPALVRKAVDMMLAAERPILYVGGGVVNANASEQLLALAEALNLPVTADADGARRFPSAHPNCLGMLGMHGTYAATWDLRFRPAGRRRVPLRRPVTGRLKDFAPKARVIHVDVDAASINKNRLSRIRPVSDRTLAMSLYAR